MPCCSDEEEMQLPGSPNPVTPTKVTKLPGNDGTCHDNPDAEIALTQFDEEEESRPKQKRRRAPRVLATYAVVQRWVTGGRATLPEEDTEREIYKHEKRLTWIHLSGLKNFLFTKFCPPISICGRGRANINRVA